MTHKEIRSIRIVVITPACHAGYRSSILLWTAKQKVGECSKAGETDSKSVWVGSIPAACAILTRD